MKRRIEERVPVIVEVEKRRCELENETFEKSKEIKNLQDQLRDSLKKNSKLMTQNSNYEK